ncbi:MAG: alpha/beta fold hydrolase [Candidatus Kariarchaeaceae archaeon]
MEGRNDVDSNQTIILKDGRTLGYGEYGSKSGAPCFYFHGFIGSRLEGQLFSKELLEHKIRLIAVDRPGVGISDFQPKRKILSWPNDVLELADSLRIDRFSVLGVSGGGPYALSCAYSIPVRLTSCVIIAGMGPLEFGMDDMSDSTKQMILFAKRYPWLLRLVLWYYYGRKKSDERSIRKLVYSRRSMFLEPDIRILDNEHFLNFFTKDTMESIRQGTKGIAHELKLFTKDWGFQLQNISPKVPITLWHGTHDTTVPVTMTQEMAEIIPHCKKKIFGNEGHLSIILNNVRDLIPLII